MKKTIFATVVGLLLLFLGIITIYIYLERLNQDTSPWLLLLSLVLLGAAPVFLFKASNYQIESAKKPFNPLVEKTEESNILTRNNEMVNDYHKTANARDKLQLLKAASDKKLI